MQWYSDDLIAQHCLSSADTERFRGHIQSELLGLSVSQADRRIFATLLTWLGHLNVMNVWVEMGQESGPFQVGILWSFVKAQPIIGNDRLQASCRWLCQMLVPGMTMNGSFFSNENLYTELSLQYAHAVFSG